MRIEMKSSTFSRLKAAIIILVLLSVVHCADAQDKLIDVIYTENGSEIRGMIVEQIFGESVTIKTTDDVLLDIDYDKIVKIGKEEYANNTSSNLQDEIAEIKNDRKRVERKITEVEEKIAELQTAVEDRIENQLKEEEQKKEKEERRKLEEEQKLKQKEKRRQKFLMPGRKILFMGEFGGGTIASGGFSIYPIKFLSFDLTSGIGRYELYYNEFKNYWNIVTLSINWNILDKIISPFIAPMLQLPLAETQTSSLGFILGASAGISFNMYKLKILSGKNVYPVLYLKTNFLLSLVGAMKIRPRIAIGVKI